MRCAAVALLSVALLNGALAASASFQVFPNYGEPAIYEDQAFNAEVLVTPSNSFDSSRLGGAIYYIGSGGERINLGSVFGFVAGSASAGIYASAALGGIPKSGTYTLTVEGTVEHLGYFNNNSPEAVWGRPENFTATSTITVYEQPLGDQDAALSNMDNSKDGQISVSNNGEWWSGRTVKNIIHQSFTTGTNQVFLNSITVRDNGATSGSYYIKLTGPSTEIYFGSQRVGKYYTAFVPDGYAGPAILQPNTTYWMLIEPSPAPPAGATFDATSDRVHYRTSLGWTAGETLLVEVDSGYFDNDPYGGGFIPGYTTITPSSKALLLSISATPTGGYDGFPLAGAATKLPFDTSTAAKWSAEGSAWVVDRSVSKDGVDSIKAQTTNGQSTYRQYTVIGPAVVDFWWKVSSERNYDFFSYSINGVQREAISGEVDWAYRTLTLPAGTHTVRWTYSKDASGAIGQDAGWLDDLAVYPAEANLRVRDGATLISGTTTVGFGSSELQGTPLTKTLVFANEGYVPLEVAISLPQGSAFYFAEGLSYELLLGRGESVEVPISLSTESAGTKSAQLSISAPDSVTLSPTITLQGVVLGQKIGVAQGTTPIAPGQSVSMGLAPRSVHFTVRNTGNVGNLEIAGITTTGRFLITQQPHATIAPQGSTTFTVLAQTTDFGHQAGSVTIASNDPDTPTFTIPLTSRSFAAIPEGLAEGSVATFGLAGAAGWDLATTLLPSGQTGPAMKSGATPDNGASILEATLQTAGVISWTWKVSSQEDFDWLLCEVDGQEAAGISTKNGVWQTQVVQVPAGANVRWVYRKDGSGNIGEDAGYLADVEFRSFAANQSFSQWAQTHGISDPLQRMPKSGMQAMFGWLGGFGVDGENTDDIHKAWILSGTLKYRFPISKTADGTQQILYSPDMTSWTTRRISQRVVSEDADRVVIEATAPSGTKGFFKVVGGGDTTSPVMALIPAGSFSMGDAFGEGDSNERPVHTVNVSAFYMDKYEVTKALWDEVANWAAANGYDISAASADGKAANHPAYNITWYEAVKWSNARSAKENLTPCYTVGGAVMKTGTSTPDCNFSASGYRLPTEAEWEKAARGGLSGKRFPWGDTITHSEANYYSDAFFSYDVSPTRGYHPTYETGSQPYSSPVGSFAPNAYGLYDMAGNMWEWCWDRYSSSYYASSPSSDPRGATSGSYRVGRGGGWGNYANGTRAADRDYGGPGDDDNGDLGFRCVRSSVP